MRGGHFSASNLATNQNAELVESKFEFRVAGSFGPGLNRKGAKIWPGKLGSRKKETEC
jgi:hypothetical protein